MSGMTLSSEISWEEEEERLTSMRGPMELRRGMDGDASASSPLLSSLVSIFLPVRSGEKNPFVTFWGREEEKNGSAAHRRFQRFW